MEAPWRREGGGVEEGALRNVPEVVGGISVQPQGEEPPHNGEVHFLEKPRSFPGK